MSLKITSNGRWKQFKYRDEVPKKILRDQFNYQDPEDTIDGFFEFKNTWYHLDQFMRLPRGGFSDATGSGAKYPWNGYAGDSYFSGVVIQLSDDGEEYRVGMYMS